MADEQSASPLIVKNVHLCYRDEPSTTELYDVVCSGSRVASVYRSSERRNDPAMATVLDAGGRGLLVPGLCHAHIHLDKCFLLDRCTLETGDFAEALRVTASAKARFPEDEDDLLCRGKRLILDSVACGVTSMRAHVEIDTTVGMACLRAGIRLKDEMTKLCHVQIAAFAQDPLFDESGNPNANHPLLVEASRTSGVEAVGSAPYVEAGKPQALQNIRFLFDLACERGMHLDFHLDYNLDSSAEALVWFVLEQLSERISGGTWKASQHLCIGHATRLTLWSHSEWHKFAQTIRERQLPITLVGLPQSDMYMMGRDVSSPPRGTLNVPRLAREHGLRLALAVNNVGNAFTPQGPPDPLALCPLGVALYQAGTKEDCTRLLEAVTLNACEAIGFPAPQTHQSPGEPSTHRAACHAHPLVPQTGSRADFVLLHDNASVQSAACNPSHDRTTIAGGLVVCRRETTMSFPSTAS